MAAGGSGGADRPRSVFRGAQAGGELLALGGAPGEAQAVANFGVPAALGVVRVQSRPPPPAKQFETPRRTVKPFNEGEVETLVAVRGRAAAQSATLILS